MADISSQCTSGTQQDGDMCNCSRREVDYYCYTDNVLLCKLCKQDLHLKCETEPLYTVADGVFDSRDYLEAIRELRSIKSAFLKFKSSDTLDGVRNSIERQSAIGDAKRLKIKREKSKLEREMKVTISDFQKYLTSERVLEKQDCAKMVNEIDNYLDLIDQFRQDGDKKKTFILLFKLKTIIPLILDILNSLFDRQRHHLVNSQIKGTLQRYMKSDNPGNVKLSRSLYNPEYVSPRRVSRASQNFSKSRDIEDFIDFDVTRATIRLQGSPRILDVTDTSTNHSRSSVTRYVTTASFDGKLLTGIPTQYILMNTKGVQEKRISTMKVTHDGRILVLDYYNQLLEMYGLNKKFLSALNLKRPIWDFDFTNDYEVLVTCPYDGTLQYVQFSDEDVMFETSFIPTDKGCRAICCFPNRLFVSYTGDNPCIRYLSKEGVTYRTIQSIMNGILCLMEPLFIHVSPDRKYLFVSDYTLQRITVLNHHGDIVRSHDTYPGCPLAMTSDREGNVLTSVARTNEIRMISRDGSRSRTLIESTAILGQPCAVTYKIESKLVLVAFDKEAVVKMYHII